MQTIPSPSSTPPGALFQCKATRPTSAGVRVTGLIGIGVIVGAAGWFEVDRTISLSHLAAWIVPISAVFVALIWLVERNPLMSICIDDAGLLIRRAGDTRTFAWGDIEAARFQKYPIAHSGGQSITCLLIRVGGKNIELVPEFDDDATREAFEEAIFCELESRDIPETSPGLPSFQRHLSLGGAWVFVASIVGLLIAHALGYHTMGTIFGLAFLLTGSVVAWMTRGERLSQLILAATIVLIVGGSAILWVCHVNVRQVLQKWEQMEKR